MGIEALKQQLADGKLTKEQFTGELKKLLDAGTIDQTAHDTTVAEVNADDNSGQALTAEQVRVMMAEEIAKAKQSEGDRVRTEYAAKLKAEQEENERLLKEKMSDEEKTKYEREQYEKKLADREAALNAREIELHLVDKLREFDIDSDFQQFAPNFQTKEDVAAFASLVSKSIKAGVKRDVDARFKEAGSTPPPGGKGGTGGVKKWSEMTLTEQGKMFAENPEQARVLAKQSGTPLKY